MSPANTFRCVGRLKRAAWLLPNDDDPGQPNLVPRAPAPAPSDDNPLQFLYHHRVFFLLPGVLNRPPYVNARNSIVVFVPVPGRHFSTGPIVLSHFTT
eukprot:1686912-Rhodomonas_salina.1